MGFGVSLYIQVVTRGSLAQQASVLSSIVAGGSAELLIPSSVDLAVGNVRNITRLGTETGLTAETATQVNNCRYWGRAYGMQPRVLVLLPRACLMMCEGLPWKLQVVRALASLVPVSETLEAVSEVS
jgi:hypothetical protein